MRRWVDRARCGRAAPARHARLRARSGNMRSGRARSSGQAHGSSNRAALTVVKPVGGGDAGGDADLGLDRHGEGRAVARIVDGDHFIGGRPSCRMRIASSRHRQTMPLQSRHSSGPSRHGFSFAAVIRSASFSRSWSSIRTIGRRRCAWRRAASIRSSRLVLVPRYGETLPRVRLLQKTFPLGASAATIRILGVNIAGWIDPDGLLSSGL